MFKFFVMGGIPDMTLLTVILMALLLAAWKAPAWVKEIGIIALVVGILSFFIGFYRAAGDVVKAGDIANSVAWGGFRVAIISVMYGLLIYLVSLIIRIIQKPLI